MPQKIQHADNVFISATSGTNILGDFSAELLLRFTPADSEPFSSPISNLVFHGFASSNFYGLTEPRFDGLRPNLQQLTNAVTFFRKLEKIIQAQAYDDTYRLLAVCNYLGVKKLSYRRLNSPSLLNLDIREFPICLNEAKTDLLSAQDSH